MVDVITTAEIARPRGEVARYAADPDKVTEWYENIKAIEWKTPKPLMVPAMRRANEKDLQRLKQLLEQ